MCSDVSCLCAFIHVDIISCNSQTSFEYIEFILQMCVEKPTKKCWGLQSLHIFSLKRHVNVSESVKTIITHVNVCLGWGGSGEGR